MVRIDKTGSKNIKYVYRLIKSLKKIAKVLTTEKKFDIILFVEVIYCPIEPLINLMQAAFTPSHKQQYKPNNFFIWL